MENETDKNRKIKEPFPPEHTPQPPQIKDPSRPAERNEPEGGKIRAEERKKKPAKSEKPAEEQKNQQLNEGAEINDETTI